MRESAAPLGSVKPPDASKALSTMPVVTTWPLLSVTLASTLHIPGVV